MGMCDDLTFIPHLRKFLIHKNFSPPITVGTWKIVDTPSGIGIVCVLDGHVGDPGAPPA